MVTRPGGVARAARYGTSAGTTRKPFSYGRRARGPRASATSSPAPATSACSPRCTTSVIR